MQVAFDVAASRTAPAEARACVRPLASDLKPDVYADLRLVVSELVANAVKYGPGSPIHVTITVERRDRVRGAVIDDGDPADGPHIVPEPGAGGGYGMRLVDAVASSWGVQDGSTEVWFAIGG